MARWSKHHGFQRGEYERITEEREDRAKERDRARVEREAYGDEDTCRCGWITAREVCPMCNKPREVANDEQ